MKPLFTKGSQNPYVQPDWIDGNCPVSMLRGRLKTNLEFARQSKTDSMEYFSCMQRAAHLERLISEREDINHD